MLSMMLDISKFNTVYKRSVKDGATGRSRTDNPLFTKQAHCHCATVALAFKNFVIGDALLEGFISRLDGTPHNRLEMLLG